MTTQSREIPYCQTPEQKKYLPLFDLCAPKDNWKTAINTMVNPMDLTELNASKQDLADAVEFVTGSKATITREGNNYRVVADGYYAACGA